MKDAAFLEQLQQELPRRSLSPKATQRFEDTYKMLACSRRPGEKTPPQGAVGHGPAACLCCGMLFGVNAVFPAIAEKPAGSGQSL